MTTLSNINPSNSIEFVPISTIYLGVNVMNLLSDMEARKHSNLIQDFLLRVRQFVIVSCEPIQKRFNFNDPVLKYLHALNPLNALSLNFRNELPSLNILMRSCGRMMPLPEALSPIGNNNCSNNEQLLLEQLIDDEWRKLPISILTEEIKNEEIPTNFG